MSDEDGFAQGAHGDQVGGSAAGSTAGTTDSTAAADAPAPAGRRGRLWLAVTASVLLSAAVVTGIGWGWLAFATQSTSAAAQELTAVSKKLADVTELRGTALDKARASLSSMAPFVEHARPAYLSEATSKALADAQATLTAKSAKLTYAPFDAPKVAAGSADLLPWTVVGDVQSKLRLAHEEDVTRRTRASELEAIDAAQKRFAASAAAAYTELAAHGEQVESADTSATYESRIALRHAIDDGKAGVLSAQYGGPGLLQLIAAADGVDAAQAVGEAAKRDPAYPVRAQIEQYARSIAHGVTLDFQWHEKVSGLGAGWYSGTTMYHEEDGGWATIDLNFDIQSGWTSGDIDAKALVTHEVGHAQVVRPECKTLFDGPTFNQNDEMWATAWAIAMGFDTAGSGISAYGRPSDQQIAVAGQCR